MSDSFDVVVVGARCAGSPLATLLARAGLSVAVVEQATFPRDTLSTHNFQADALAFLDRLGVRDRLRATGAPFIRQVSSRAGDFHWSMSWPQEPGDIGGVASIRRFVLDPILAHAAAAAGADVRMGTKVVGLVGEDGRVTGVRVAAGRTESTLRAPLVVGADGRGSAVARFAGARRYDAVTNERFTYWAFFAGTDSQAEPTMVFHRWDTRFVLGLPVDGGLYMVIVMPDLAELTAFRSDLERCFMEHARSCEPIASVLAGARREGSFRGALRWEGYFREASGPGWVLVGDAGHFKDPAAGRGIADAFRQVEGLAPAIVAGLDGSGAGLDAETARWGRWRDSDLRTHHWFAHDLGKAGMLPAVLPEMLRALEARGELDQFMNLFSHRAEPSRVLTPARLLGATTRLLGRRTTDRHKVLTEVRALVAEDARRRLHRRAVRVVQ